MVQLIDQFLFPKKYTTVIKLGDMYITYYGKHLVMPNILAR